MPSLRILYDVDHWAYHNRALALQKFAPPDFDVSIVRMGCAEEPWMELGNPCMQYQSGWIPEDAPPDLLLALPRIVVPQLRERVDRLGLNTRIIASWNAGWPSRAHEFGLLHRIADLVIINNRGFWKGIGEPHDTRVLANGVDLDIFNVRHPIAGRRTRVLWAGSQMAREKKGWDDYLLPLRQALATHGIACDFQLLDSVHGDKRCATEMADWYNTGTILVCASDSEGTPNIALEAAACGCTVVSTAVGNMPELIVDGHNGYLVERRLDALLDGVLRACANYEALANNMQQTIDTWGWRERSAEFYGAFRKLMAATGQRRKDPESTVS